MKCRVLALAALALAGAANAQSRWTQIDGPAPRFERAAWWDETRGVPVGLANARNAPAEIWTWGGRGELRVDSPARPPSLSDAALAFDPIRRRAVVFGGYPSLVGRRVCLNGHGHDPSTCRSTTWEWDGSTWGARAIAAAPPPRARACMAFDPGSGRTLLFGGDTCFCSLSPSLGDTWSWDGTSWLEVGASGGPSPRSSALLASDPLRGEVLLFGGLADRAPKNELVHETFVETELRSDTWVWRRGRWERREPRHSPPPASAWGCGLAFDERRGRVLLLRMGHGEPAETWEWDGTDWQQACPGNAPRAATLDALVYDRAVGRVVARTWREDTSLTATWEWDGADWIERTASPRAAGRILHAMAWDSERKRLVLFGGAREERPVFPWSGRPWAMADTWEWDGAYWELRLPATSPPARAGHAMAWDSRRKRVVLFGGKDEGGVLLADTWEWDGTDWSVRPGPAPPARHLHAMAFDSRRARVVLFGGEGWFGAFGDTCEWDGDSWKVWTPRVGPGARLGHRLLELPSPGRLLVSKGRRWESDIGLSDAWEWDGSAWSRIERDDGRSAIARAFASDPPGGRRGAAVAFDAAGRALYLYGGIGPSGPVAELWRLDLP